MSDELTPITRKEIFLAKAGGQNVVTPTPITREETFLQAIIDNGSGGGGGTGGGVLIVGIDIETMILDKTWKEIHDAPFAVVRSETSIGYIYTMAKHPVTGECVLMVALGGAENETVTWHNSVFVATTENDYLVMQQ